MTDSDIPATERSSARSYKLTEDIAAGLFLFLIALFFLWQAWDLPLGRLRAVGPGMLPVSIATILGAGGLVLALAAFLKGGPILTTPHVRGLFFILGGIILFGLLIRTMGLIVAGPVSMIFGSFATNEVRVVEAVIFAAIMTTFCILLFKYALGLPIPVVAFM